MLSSEKMGLSSERTAVPDPDLEIRGGRPPRSSGKGVGGGGVAVCQKFFHPSLNCAPVCIITRSKTEFRHALHLPTA